MYEKINRYTMRCDMCRTVLLDMDLSPCEGTRIDLIDIAQADNWHVDGGEHYCPNCYFINDDDEVELIWKELI